MKNRFYFLLVSLFCFAEIFAQTTKLQGKITNQEEIEGIHILNNNSRNNTVIDAFGNFSINAKEQDTLVFSSVNYLPKKVGVTEAMIEKRIIVVTLDKLINQLDEVFLGSRLTGDLGRDVKNIKIKKKIDFDSLGIPGFKGEPQEKIPTVIGQTIGPTFINIDALYNHISGYYRKLRIQRKWQTENNTVARILYQYDEAFFLETYKIPKDKTYDFLLFCIDTTSLQTNFNRENYGIVLDIFKEQAAEYVSRIANNSEKKE